jgi:hypothetical protein
MMHFAKEYQNKGLRLALKSHFAAFTGCGFANVSAKSTELHCAALDGIRAFRMA